MYSHGLLAKELKEACFDVSVLSTNSLGLGNNKVKNCIWNLGMNRWTVEFRRCPIKSNEIGFRPLPASYSNWSSEAVGSSQSRVDAANHLPPSTSIAQRWQKNKINKAAIFLHLPPSERIWGDDPWSN